MDKRLTQIVIALAGLGLLDSIYMTIFKLTNNESMCIGNGGCSLVNASAYSQVNGIPVAAIGVVGYLAILALLLLEPRIDFLSDNGSILLFGLSITGFLFTLWLIYVEVALLKALCPFCVTSQIVMTIIFVLSVVRVIRQPLTQED